MDSNLFSENKYELFIGNNIDLLRDIEDNSIDSIVTDPPYGLGTPPNIQDVMVSWLKDGYYNVSGGGFMGKEWDSFVPQPIFWKEIYRVLKPGGHILVFSGTRTQDWMSMAIRFSGFYIKDTIAWIYGSGMPKGLSIDKSIDKYYNAERKVIGKKISTYDGCNRDPNKHKTINETAIDSHKWGYSKKPHSLMETELATELAKLYYDWNTQLKPAMEPIILAQKPISENTIAENVIKWGVGGINIGKCRVGISGARNNGRKVDSDIFGKYGSTDKVDYNKGRFPSNIIHDGSDEVEELFPYTKSGIMNDNHTRHTNGSPNGIYGKFDVNYPLSETIGDEGSASRFFYCAKVSKKERNTGTDNNNHVTVKPIELMKYLVRLVTPPNGIILDPFMGSGSTGIASMIEGFRFIGMEQDKEYYKISNDRISSYKLYINKKSTNKNNKKIKPIVDYSDFY